MNFLRIAKHKGLESRFFSCFFNFSLLASSPFYLIINQLDRQ